VPLVHGGESHMARRQPKRSGLFLDAPAPCSVPPASGNPLAARRPGGPARQIADADRL